MFCIVTDITADLPMEYVEENDIRLLYFSYILDGETYGEHNKIDPKKFYDLMREGKMPTTSQINPEEAKAFFSKLCETEKEVLVIAFSSGLSGSCNNISLAAKEICEEDPSRKIVVFDSLGASMGEGMMVYKAVELRKKGYSMEETLSWLMEHRFEFVHVFTVNDLFHLFRGGRVSRTAAVIGTLAGIKPMLHVDNEGHLINIDKIRGRKKALHALVDYMEEKREGYQEENPVVMITHGDSLEDAQYVADLIRDRFKIENIMINDLGPVIGAHTGPGLISLFFMGKNR